MLNLFKISSIFAFFSIVAYVLFALLIGLVYTNLSKENLVAQITFDHVGNQDKTYMAHVLSPEGNKIGDYLIYGDQWRMDAEFIKMKYWANVLGVDSKYALNRIEGRYKNIHDENHNMHKSYQLESHTIIDTFPFLLDTTYGSSVYQDIKLGVKYKVLHSPTGLLIRQAPTIPEKGYWGKTKELFGF